MFTFFFPKLLTPLFAPLFLCGLKTLLLLSNITVLCSFPTDELSPPLLPALTFSPAGLLPLEKRLSSLLSRETPFPPMTSSLRDKAVPRLAKSASPSVSFLHELEFIDPVPFCFSLGFSSTIFARNSFLPCFNPGTGPYAPLFPVKEQPASSLRPSPSALRRSLDEQRGSIFSNSTRLTPSTSLIYLVK